MAGPRSLRLALAGKLSETGGLGYEDLDMLQFINRFRRDEEGAALVEYGMLVGLIAVICIAAVTLLGQEVSDAFSNIASALAGI
jgi:pilus assembly protein Flp/PilA